MKNHFWINCFLVLLLALFVGSIYIYFSFHRSHLAFSFVSFSHPNLLTDERLLENLESNDDDVILETLAFLHRSQNFQFIELSIPFLESDNEYVWLNAAHYLGVCGRQEAVPYLIKGLRHTAFRADEESVDLLRKLTGQEFDANFGEWYRWWSDTNSHDDMDWESHLGFDPRL